MFLDRLKQLFSRVVPFRISRGLSTTCGDVSINKKKLPTHTPDSNTFYKIKQGVGAFEYRGVTVFASGAQVFTMYSIVDDTLFTLSEEAFYQLFVPVSLKIVYRINKKIMPKGQP